MSQINLLSPHLADLIAAGEVVERPASVVKELLENAFDAGAKSVTIELRGGGMTYIRITDDGCGMSPEDAGMAFLRHATSKLRTAQDLEAIGTLGFRGEALAAISAVSRIELRTRECGADSGTRITLEAGDIQTAEPVGCPKGTTIIVRDLFYNTPARLKFLKSDRAEASACINLAKRCTLGHPEISVRCIHDGKEVFFSPGDGDAKSCIYHLLGREFAGTLLPCSTDDGVVSVHGFVSSPAAARGTRTQQFFFCNGRPIRSTALQAALEQAYQNTLLSGRFPACVLSIDLSFAAVEVNVHPTKAEVKFSDERLVFNGVYYAALAALGAESRPAGSITLTKPAAAAPARAKSAPRGDFFKEMTAAEFRTTIETLGKTPSNPAPQQTIFSSPRVKVHDFSTPYRTNVEKKPLQPVSVTLPDEPADEPLPAAATPAPQPDPEPEVLPATPESVPEPIPEPVPEPEEPAPLLEPEPFRVIGEALGAYIIVEYQNELTLIDKHAAHERILFDRLKTQRHKPMSQTLLLPLTLSADAEHLDVLLERADLLAEFGFALESYGEDAIAIRAVPADVDLPSVPAMLEDLAETLLHHGSADPEAAVDHILHTVACKAAIKAGASSQPEELAQLAARVMSGEIRYCPHGRPVAVTLTRQELDKYFKRIL